MAVPSANPLAFFEANAQVVRVALTRVRGSSPRARGTEMFVGLGDTLGTIGGGRLEHIAIERARRMLAEGGLSDHLDVPLGPEIGQCCGGRVEVSLKRMSAADRHAACRGVEAERAAYPHVFALGAGHVGRALANLLQHLPVRCVLTDMRAEELAKSSARVEKRLRAIPEVEVLTAPRGSAFIILTHDHGLDFLLASSALELGHAAYVGMIGSATKRAKFAAWCQSHCGGLAVDRLVCPIGAHGSRDKRLEIIAAFVAAEVLAALTARDLAIGG